MSIQKWYFVVQAKAAALLPQVPAVAARMALKRHDVLANVRTPAWAAICRFQMSI